MKTAKRIISLIAIGLFPSILLAEGEPPLSASVPQDSDYSISQTELKKGRPANGFKLVYSENDAVCQPVLAALNEPGYDSRYFNQSDKFENTLPELLIQTRLNVPRTLIGTHLYRTEEYEIKDAESGQTEYWYRLIGQGSVIWGQSALGSDKWFNHHNKKFNDFMQFVDYSPSSYRALFRLTFNYKHDSKLLGKISALEIAVDDWLSKYAAAMNYRTSFIELIFVNNDYYLMAIGRESTNTDTVNIIVFNNKDKVNAFCFIQSIYKLRS